MVLYNCPIVITGDLNLHLDVSGNRDARRFHELLDIFGLCQSVSGATHRDGHTLDVVVTRGDLPSPTVDVRPSGEYSDHSLILFQLQLPRPPLRFVDVNTRAWKGFDADHFHDDLLSSPLCCQSLELEHLSADELQELCDNTMSLLLDKHAPPRIARRHHQPTTPWFDADCAAAKRRVRMFERRYRRTLAAADHYTWIFDVRKKHQLYTRKQNIYWETKIADSHGNPRKLWSNLTSVFWRRKSRISNADGLDAEHFLKAFAAKIDGVRSLTASAPDPLFTDLNTDVGLHVFEPVDATPVLRLVYQAPNKNCELDPVPTWLVKQFSGDLSPIIARLLDASFRDV